MDITLVYKVIGIGLIVMFSGMVLDRADRKEQSLLISLSGIVAVLLMLVDKLAELFQKIKFIFGL
ncbi:MAG: stage III sporulation protein AC [Clostridia bacterium]|nr:stage III sporulation protein AC [Clostridia bacterium]